MFTCSSRATLRIIEVRHGSETILEREFSVVLAEPMERIPEVRGFDQHEIGRFDDESSWDSRSIGCSSRCQPLFTVPYTCETTISLKYTVKGSFIETSNQGTSCSMSVETEFGQSNYAGIVDFGMSLINNRKQNEPLPLAERNLTRIQHNRIANSKNFEDTTRPRLVCSLREDHGAQARRGGSRRQFSIAFEQRTCLHGRFACRSSSSLSGCFSRWRIPMVANLFSN